MRLTLKNIGKIENADVKIDGITIIAGENNTGKSTVGKILFSVFNGFYKISDQVKRERASNIGNLTGLLFQDARLDDDESKRVEIRNFFHGLQSLQDAIVSETMRYYSEVQLLKDRIRERILDFNSQYGTRLILESDIDNYIEEVGKSFHISDDDIMRVLLQRRLNDEFGGQINNIFSESEGVIDFEIRNKRVQIMMRDNKIFRMTGSFNLITESAYIDDPFVLDNLGELGFMPLSERLL